MKILKTKSLIAIALALLSLSSLWGQSDTSWPKTTIDMHPGTRWWWMGSAVDTANLDYCLRDYARTGIGMVEITPIYGVQGNDANEIPYLSPKWMKMLAFTEKTTKKLGMYTDMITGTGWPFGGPQITIQNAASKLLVRTYHVEGGSVFNEKIIPEDKNQVKVARLQRLMAYQGTKVLNLTGLVDKNQMISWKVPSGKWEIIAAFNGKTFQKVKRAAPGGKGYVMDHFSAKAVKTYLSRFENAFDKTHTAYPHDFFNDSYEVFKADWTADFFDQFYKRRGYKLENYLPEFLSSIRNDETDRLVSDYRQTISDLLLENFTEQWTNWAHSHGSKTRDQAHGSPGNLIDLYAAVDVPECEGFGLSDFGIKGLRKDSLTRKNYSDLSMLKYASSAAHISGKQLTSSETFTWLTEHFRASLSQCKPDLDLMYVSGVNHVNFHGTAYSPKSAAWPGWKFYASIDMSPTNTIWRDAPALMKYITRCQSFLQTGKPDNDFLIYLPVFDAWYNQPGRLLLFDIQSMGQKMPDFIKAVHAVYESGYDMDYISDRYILTSKCVNGKIVTSGGSSYNALILPDVKRMPVAVIKHIAELTAEGAKIVFLGGFPNDVPGFYNVKERQGEFRQIIRKLDKARSFKSPEVHPYKKGEVITGSDYKLTLASLGIKPEEMITKFGLHAIRRSNSVGYTYFISALHPQDLSDWVALAVPAKSVEIFDPMTGKTGKALTRQKDGSTQVYLQLQSGQSVILKTFTDKDIQINPWRYKGKEVQTLQLNEPWTLKFVNSSPAIKETFTLQKLISWTKMDNDTLKVNAGTGVYETTFDLDKVNNNEIYLLKLGDVRESAHVYVNGQDAGRVWAAPFQCRIGKYLKSGKNYLKVEVTNLNANRISDYDRRGIKWRIFKEINMVNLNYKKTGYGNWKPMPSGLCSPVKLELYSVK